jgi:hypothetical protein
MANRTISDFPTLTGSMTGNELLLADVPQSNGTIATLKVLVSQLIGLFGGGVSVVNPGTGSFEMVLPLQTVNGASKSFGQTDLFKKTRRAASGSAMTDTFPGVSTLGMANGARINISNFDASASLTITAGTGTAMPTGTTDVIGPGRDVSYVLDTTFSPAVWRGDDNTRGVLLSANNLSDLTNISLARANLGVTAPIFVNTVTSNTTLQAGATYRINAAGLTLTLPASPISNDTIHIIDGGGITLANPPTLARNANTIMGIAQNMTINVPGIDFTIWWTGSDWRLF